MDFNMPHFELPFFTNLLILLVVAKVFGEIFERFKQPAMIGEIIAGIIVGPSLLNIVHRTEDIKVISELGIFLLVIIAGLEINLDDILKSLKGFKGVVSTGGGIILNKKHCDMMKEGFVIYLDTPLEELKVRISKSNQRPKSISDHLETLYEQRSMLYKNCAHLIVFNHLPIEETIKDIMKHLEA
jgi:hypothetical protein